MVNILNAQIGIGTNMPNANSVLDITSTNSSGFTSLFARLRSTASTYSGRPTSAYWWTSSESNSLNAIYRTIDNANFGIIRSTNTTKSNGYCVRCLKD